MYSFRTQGGMGLGWMSMDSKKDFSCVFGQIGKTNKQTQYIRLDKQYSEMGYLSLKYLLLSLLLSS